MNGPQFTEASPIHPDHAKPVYGTTRYWIYFQSDDNGDHHPKRGPTMDKDQAHDARRHIINHL
jgi:hypothetical protein